MTTAVRLALVNTHRCLPSATASRRSVGARNTTPPSSSDRRPEDLELTQTDRGRTPCTTRQGCRLYESRFMSDQPFIFPSASSARTCTLAHLLPDHHVEVVSLRVAYLHTKWHYCLVALRTICDRPWRWISTPHAVIRTVSTTTRVEPPCTTIVWPNGQRTAVTHDRDSQYLLGLLRS
jgi:hypothetical protein